MKATQADTEAGGKIQSDSRGSKMMQTNKRKDQWGTQQAEVMERYKADYGVTSERPMTRGGRAAVWDSGRRSSRFGRSCLLLTAGVLIYVQTCRVGCNADAIFLLMVSSFGGDGTCYKCNKIDWHELFRFSRYRMASRCECIIHVCDFPADPPVGTCIEYSPEGGPSESAKISLKAEIDLPRPMFVTAVHLALLEYIIK